MDLRHFRTFVTLAEELHFGRTAHRLHTAQPVISRTIKELEQELGVQLFSRSARQTELTASGEAFLPSAKAVLDNCERGARAARAGTSKGIEHLRLGLLIGAAQPEVGRILRRFREANPIATIIVSEVDEDNFANALVAKDIDAAVAWDASIPPGLHSERIASVPMSAIVPDDHRLARRKSLELLDMQGEDIILPIRQKQPVIAERYRSICDAKGFTPNIMIEVATTIDMLALVSGGVGIGNAPITPGLAYPGVSIVPLKLDFEIEYRLTWAAMSPTIKSLLASLC
jgi:DNA-binding transcriptional LysR family regulator